MAISTRKYLLYTIFLVSPISLSLFAQTTAEKPTFTAAGKCALTASSLLNQTNDNAGSEISKLDNCHQFIAKLSTPKDSFAIAAETDNSSTECQENAVISATSILAKDIIENYKYDFSETFIDILFFERIDLSRTRNI
ncbi:hypothetical protein [Flavobacterium reichenbachii]|uniref:Uncharacterized protein n=1 Tax=Flavobacterium reichenbachii TaxID=362418 RepID=A0A085ZSP7_9FLAO|nr:hypothetical protein [Flavobacterium reichenbachii]KFF07461.1 hypothetical protein IW19_18960 [Flavobacterium reichenbachii]OXB14102.1 hypothetical protein B0A68_12810 [Flavobacterium reichenbachii]